MALNRVTSKRSTLTIDRIFALVVVDANGQEGILRRDTPYGTIPWITDDRSIVEAMITMAKDKVTTPIRVAEFERIT